MLSKFVDLGFRTAYRTAYQVMKAWWFVRRPRHEGVFVGVWHGPRILVIRNSYKRWIALPGGGRARDESTAEAAVRELAEEVGIQVAPADLRLCCTVSHATEYRPEDVPFLEVDVAEEIDVAIDNREIVWAGFVEAREALDMDLYPPVRQYLEQHARQ
jgi:8-oxo-dGTP pyrophosphatase MutT (NUDIX family)